MLQVYKLNGDLVFNQYKAISCEVVLKVETFEYDPWAKEPQKNSDDFIDGLKVTGVLSFETSPIYQFQDKHPVKENAIGKLTLRDANETTKFNVLITDKKEEKTIIDRQLKRYSWNFFSLGKPSWDELEIFPKNYKGIKMNRIYSCVDFRGYWPVGVASVVVASNPGEAKEILTKTLKDLDIPLEGDGDFNFVEIDIDQKGAIILNKGDY